MKTELHIWDQFSQKHVPIEIKVNIQQNKLERPFVIGERINRFTPLEYYRDYIKQFNLGYITDEMLKQITLIPHIITNQYDSVYPHIIYDSSFAVIQDFPKNIPQQIIKNRIHDRVIFYFRDYMQKVTMFFTDT